MARVYVNATIFGGRIIGMRNLWEPSTQYQGKPTTKPNYLTSIIVKKTVPHWSAEPQFAGFTAALQELFSKDLGPRGVQFPQVRWPVIDGDMSPEPGKQPAEWMRGHWYLKGNSGEPINVDCVQNGHVVKLHNRSSVKPGDYVTVSGAVAVKQNDPYGVKFFINNVLFMSPGEEIAVGNGVTGAELMEQARAAGMQITGFAAGHSGFATPAPGGFAPAPSGFAATAPAPGGFAPAPNGGFGVGMPSGAPAPAPMQPPAQPQGGFGQPNFGQPGAPAPSQGSFVQQVASGQTAGGFAPTTYPSNQPGGFAPPATGFAPPR